MAIVIGQRWMSVAEPELGLGVVQEVDRRQVRLFFSSSDETRVYALQSAPIERVILKVGDSFSTAQEKKCVVESVEEMEGLLHYHFGSTRISEADLTESRNLSTADQRLLDGRQDTTELFLLRRLAWERRSQIQRHPAHGYLGARMDLIPHQLYIAHEVAERRCPRVLLSDEVGLGKTIEACLILHRLYLRGQSGRVLILVPEPLIHQWFVELYRRFNLTCSIFDEARCAAIQGEAGMGSTVNPLLDEHLVLTSTSLFKKHPVRLEQALAADWGLVIVDEAHHLKWTPEKASADYEMVEAFSKLSQSLLLLTGTPEQFGMEGHFARLRLLDAERYHDYETFQRETEHYHKIASVVESLLEAEKPTAKELAAMKKLFVNRQDLLQELTKLGQGTIEDGQLREALIEDLLDRHGTGRAVYRNTRAAIPGFPKRRVYPTPLSYPIGQEAAAEIVQNEIDFELGVVEKLSRRKLEKDPRIEWLVRLLKKHPEEKFLLICRYQKRAEALYEALRAKVSVSMTVFHEEQTILQRDRNAAWFAKPAPDGARLLICSEIGSEGRNFQFAHHLVLFDLPLDPELLEQRIGRLDRIGQRETIHLHVPFFKESGGELLYRWFHEGVDAFKHPVQGGALLLEEFLPRLRLLLGAGKSGEEDLEAFLKETTTYREDLQKTFEKGRDRLLEWHSCRPEQVAPLIAGIQDLDKGHALGDFLLAALDHFGVHVEKLAGREGLGGRENRSWLLMPGHLMTDQLTIIPAEGKMITFDRSVALDRDDVDFMTWDHPLVFSLLDLLLSSEAGNAAFTEVKAAADVAAGFYMEMIFILEPVCPVRYDLNRFLPATSLRVCVDAKAKVLDSAFLEALDAAGRSDAAKHALTGQAKALKPFVDQSRAAAEKEVEAQAKGLRAKAHEEMMRSLTTEIERLKALRESSGKAGGREREYLREEREVMGQAIHESHLRLDALRLIRVS